jgi:hypothetical protein
MLAFGSPWRALPAQLARIRNFLAILLVCTLVACSGGGGGGGGSSTPPPNASIVFPTRVSYTDAATISIRGTASGPNGVAGVTVNGVAATSSDSFANWIAVVPVTAGTMTVTVSVRDAAGNTRSAADTVTIHNRGSAIVGMRGMDVDTANGRILVSDQNTKAVYAVRATDGRVSALSDRSHGTGADFDSIEDLVVDATRNRALVLDWGQDTLVAVDLSSGNRTVASASSGSGAATAFSLGFGVALDAVGNRAFVTSRGNNSVVAVNLATGTRTVASSASVGTGPSFVNPLGVVYDAITSPSSPRLLVADAGLGAIVAVDLASGNRTLMSSSSPTGSGIALDQPVQVKLDASGSRLLVLDGSVSRNALVAVALANGNRTVLADSSTGSGALVSAPLALAFDTATSRAYVAPYQGGEIGQVDLGTLARTTLASANLGSGTKLVSVGGAALEQRTGTPTSLLLTDPTQGLVFRVDLTTGDRTVVAGPSAGSGVVLARPADLVLDTRSGVTTPQALILDAGTGHSVVALNLTTGVRTLLADLNSASPAVVQLRNMTLDAAGNRVLVTDAGLDAVFALNLGTGNRTVLSDAGQGSGPAFNVPSTLIFDSVSTPSAPRVIVADVQLIGLLTVSTIGDRSTFAASGGSLNINLPGDMVLDATNQRVLMTDLGHKNLMSVNLANGSRLRLSGASFNDNTVAGGGPSLEYPSAMDVDLSGNVAYVVSADRQAVMAVDMVTGDRVIVSH